MIRTDATNGRSLKEIRAAEKKEQEKQLREKCEAFASERYGEDQVKQWSNKNKGLFYLPVIDDDGTIEKLAILKPIDRQILSYASTKISDDGLYAFLEAAMAECWIEGDKEILEDDEYFIPAADSFNNIMKGKKTALLKR